MDEFQRAVVPYRKKWKDHLLWIDHECIQEGDFEDKIRQAIAAAGVAVMFVCPAFLGSSFIKDVEVPLLVAANRKGSLQLLWVALEESAYKETALCNIECFNGPDNPIRRMRPEARSHWWRLLGERIAELVSGDNTNGAQATIPDDL